MNGETPPGRGHAEHTQSSARPRRHLELVQSAEVVHLASRRKPARYTFGVLTREQRGEDDGDAA